MYLLAQKLLPTDKKKYESARVQIAVAGIKTLNSLQIIKTGQRCLLVRQFCRAFFERNPIFFSFASFFAQSFSLRRLLHGVYTVPLARHNVRSHTNVISVHTLERLLMLWLLVITFDTLLIKFMQTAQLTFNGRTITEFFAVLFLFRCREKVRDPPNSPRSVICWDLFFIFWGHFGVTNGRHSRSALYRAENIRDQLFV